MACSLSWEFMLTSTSGEHIRVIQADDLHFLLLKGLISLPSIPCSEIMDKSKGDALGKTLALVQTTWFMAQVISRAVQHLPISELELTTAAFAFLNFLMYALWWNKPLDVCHPILIPLASSQVPYAGLLNDKMYTLSAQSNFSVVSGAPGATNTSSMDLHVNFDALGATSTSSMDLYSAH
ncbi:hypothetical protein BT96DRAFT_1005366 [Gymnopus androsaceus JB14]|uniref:Uncharacterized protein n=1 Tax=Gymnopus androsaceus JB14 TaxID=1447944 RepID=A0A6A4GNM8_9AGAR|nr:hypothetical protein BT96DRAFT_1005366 [Gymnopus androsaceus JB14]